MTLDERIRSAAAAAHDSVRGIAMPSQQIDVITSHGRPESNRAERFPRTRRRAVPALLAMCALIAALVAVPIWRAHVASAPVAPAGQPGRVYHPALLGGLGSFRIDTHAAIGRDEPTVFFAHWTDLPDATVLLMRPQWVVDPRSGAFQTVPESLAEWVQANPRLLVGPPTSARVGTDLAVQFELSGTTDGQPYTWLCPDVGHNDCFDAPSDGRGLITVVTHDAAQYLMLGGAATTKDQPPSLNRYAQVLQTWTWGQ
jgi:hypothetical protein